MIKPNVVLAHHLEHGTSDEDIANMFTYIHNLETQVSDLQAQIMRERGCEPAPEEVTVWNVIDKLDSIRAAYLSDNKDQEEYDGDVELKETIAEMIADDLAAMDLFIKAYKTDRDDQELIASIYHLDTVVRDLFFDVYEILERCE